MVATAFFLTLAATLLVDYVVSQELCKGSCTVSDDGSKTCRFTTKLDLFASEWGYYTFVECGNEPNPTLGMELGVTYIFDQSDVSNYKHPLGFAYYPDGAHNNVDELEPSIPPPDSGSLCAETMSCPAPMYMLNNKYLGSFSNIGSIAQATTGEDNFGLDDYEPKFFHPIVDWVEMGNFSVALKLNEVTNDIFYFCHIHQFMSARIKIIDSDGAPLSMADEPELGYEYDVLSAYDKECGTFNVESFQLPHSMCPSAFVCNLPDGSDGQPLRKFSGCLESMDCAMLVGMTNGVQAESEAALFIHQMIPHHQNAVNMAKALLKTDTLKCNDISGDDDDCVLEQILRDIISGQNHQIQQMRGILESKGYPLKDACVLGPDDHLDVHGDHDHIEEDEMVAQARESSVGFRTITNNLLFASGALASFFVV